MDANRISTVAMQTYKTHGERAALRCALGDAAAVCDGIAREVAAENTIRGAGRTVTKRGQELEAIAKRCADAVWALRESIRMPDEAPQS